MSDERLCDVSIMILAGCLTPDIDWLRQGGPAWAGHDGRNPGRRAGRPFAAFNPKHSNNVNLVGRLSLHSVLKYKIYELVSYEAILLPISGQFLAMNTTYHSH